LEIGPDNFLQVVRPFFMGIYGAKTPIVRSRKWPRKRKFSAEPDENLANPLEMRLLAGPASALNDARESELRGAGERPIDQKVTAHQSQLIDFIPLA